MPDGQTVPHQTVWTFRAEVHRTAGDFLRRLAVVRTGCRPARDTGRCS